MIGSKAKWIGTLLFVSVLVIAGCDSSGPSPANDGQAPSGRSLFKGIVLGQGKVAQQIPEIRDFTKVSTVARSEKQRKAIRQFNMDLLRKIEDIRPAYFGKFRNVMRSGDRVRIQNTLDEASSVVIKAMSKMQAVKKLRTKLQKNPEYANRLSTKLQSIEGVRKASARDFEKIITMLAAGSLSSDAGESPYQPKVSTIAVVTAVAAAVAAITVAVVQSYAAAVNVATAVNVAAAAVAWVETVTPEEVTPEEQSQESNNLHREQMVDSIAKQFASSSSV